MNKQELNNKLAELYDLEPKLGKMHLIDDWNRLLPLALNNKIGFVAMSDIVLAGRDSIQIVQHYSDHETPSDATRHAIAMALIELKR